MDEESAAGCKWLRISPSICLQYGAGISVEAGETDLALWESCKAFLGLRYPKEKQPPCAVPEGIVQQRFRD